MLSATTEKSVSGDPPVYEDQPTSPKGDKSRAKSPFSFLGGKNKDFMSNSTENSVKPLPKEVKVRNSPEKDDNSPNPKSLKGTKVPKVPGVKGDNSPLSGLPTSSQVENKHLRLAMIMSEIDMLSQQELAMLHVYVESKLSAKTLAATKVAQVLPVTTTMVAPKLGDGLTQDPKTGKVFKKQPPKVRSTAYIQAEKTFKKALSELTQFLQNHRLSYDKVEGITLDENGDKITAEEFPELGNLLESFKRAKADFVLLKGPSKN
jgi:hypothetical protein